MMFLILNNPVLNTVKRNDWITSSVIFLLYLGMTRTFVLSFCAGSQLCSEPRQRNYHDFSSTIRPGHASAAGWAQTVELQKNSEPRPMISQAFSWFQDFPLISLGLQSFLKEANLQTFCVITGCGKYCTQCHFIWWPHTGSKLWPPWVCAHLVLMNMTICTQCMLHPAIGVTAKSYKVKPEPIRIKLLRTLV